MPQIERLRGSCRLKMASGTARGNKFLLKLVQQSSPDTMATMIGIDVKQRDFSGRQQPAHGSGLPCVFGQPDLRARHDPIPDRRGVFVCCPFSDGAGITLMISRAQLSDRPDQNPAQIKHVEHGRRAQDQTPGRPREHLSYAAFIPDGAVPDPMAPDKAGSRP